MRHEVIDMVLFHLGVDDNDPRRDVLRQKGRTPTFTFMKQILETNFPNWRNEVDLEDEVKNLYIRHGGSME